MVAREVDRGEARQGLVDQHVEDLAAGRAAVDVIAEIHDPLVERRRLGGVGADAAAQRPQQIGPAVDIADRIDAAIGGGAVPAMASLHAAGSLGRVPTAFSQRYILARAGGVARQLG